MAEAKHEDDQPRHRGYYTLVAAGEEMELARTQAKIGVDCTDTTNFRLAAVYATELYAAVRRPQSNRWEKLFERHFLKMSRTVIDEDQKRKVG